MASDTNITKQIKNTPPESHLLNLTAELRNSICELAVVRTQPISVYEAVRRHTPPLTRVCHQLRNEVLPVYWSQNDFLLMLDVPFIDVSFWIYERPQDLVCVRRLMKRAGKALKVVLVHTLAVPEYDGDPAFKASLEALCDGVEDWSLVRGERDGHGGVIHKLTRQ